MATERKTAEGEEATDELASSEATDASALAKVDASEAGAEAGAEPEHDGEEGIAPTQMGERRFVYGAYFAGAIVVAFIFSKILHNVWVKLGLWKPQVGEPRDDVLFLLSAAIDAARPLLLAPHACASAGRGSRAGAVEGHVALEAGGHELHCSRHRHHGSRHRIFRTDGQLLGVRHQLRLRNLSGPSHEQEVVRHPDLLGLREQGPGSAPATHQGAQHGASLRRDPDSDGDRSRSALRSEAPRSPEDELPRLHLRRDGDERRRLARRQGHAEGHRLHR